MQHLTRFLRIFFHLLYHPFAWSYDLVAWTVSLGRWKDWVKSVVPFIEGTRVLELGHGPGYLQRILRDLNLLTVGLDESRQMGNLAKKRLVQSGYAQPGLVHGLAQSLPFPTEKFNTVIATFPSEYIFEQGTLLEVRRMLTNGGRLIVLPVAWITGQGILDRFLAWLFRFTGQAPSDPFEEVSSRLKEPFLKAGFQVNIQRVEVKSSLLLIVLAEKRRQ
jgi:ubiquinone/menaquinone biosynthesis C-methylase UbiE